MSYLRPTRLEVSALCLIAAVVVYQLIVPSPIGLADNGDFARVMGRFSLSRLPGQEGEESYFVSKYRFNPEAYWDSGYNTSETLPVAIAVGLNRLVSKDGLFDIRVLGMIHTVLLLVAVWLLLLSSRKLGRTARAVFLILLIVAVTDVGYVQWFNSFYSESASYLFFLLAVALAWRLIQVQGGIPLLLVWTLTAALLVAAKPQNAPLGVALAVFTFHLRTLDAGRAWHRWCAGAAVGLLVFPAVYSRITPSQDMREMGHYGAVFYGLLVDSPNPAQDLSELGLSPDLAGFTLRDPYLPDSGADRPEFRQSFFARISYGKIARFYLRHPARLMRALDRNARIALLLRPEGMSNFERETGREPNTQSHDFEVWSFLHAKVYPRRITWLATVLAGYLAALVVVRRKRADQSGRLEVDLVTLTLAMAVIGFGVVAMAMGIMDPDKQMFLVNVLTDASLLAAAAWAAGRLAERFQMLRRSVTP
jgi:hypothetical protein